MLRPALLGLVLLIAPLTAAGQPAAGVPRIGVLVVAAASEYRHNLAAFRQGLHELGYSEGKNVAVDIRWAEGSFDRLPQLAAELVRLKVDVIVTHGTPGSLAAKRATTAIPIVMATTGDAVATGLVQSLARPGGNVTGSSIFFPELTAKRLELLKEAMPHVARVAVFSNPTNPSYAPALKAMDATARSLGMLLQPVDVRGPDDFDRAFSAIAKRQADALVIPEDAMLVTHRTRVADLARQARLATIGSREHAEAGGLMGYWVNTRELWRRAAVFVDKILKGAKPADLPVEQPTKFELVINLRAAKALGVTIPPSMLLRADEVIQ